VFDDCGHELARQRGGVRVALLLGEVTLEDGVRGALAEVRLEDGGQRDPAPGPQ